MPDTCAKHYATLRRTKVHKIHMIHDVCVRSWEASHRKWCFNVLSWDQKDEQQLAKERQETHPKWENAWALRQQAAPIFFCISSSTTHGTTITLVIMRWWGRRCEWMEGWKRKKFSQCKISPISPNPGYLEFDNSHFNILLN